MSRSVLFGYSVELDEGKIVISLSGSMASAVLNRMATTRGRGGRDALPLLPLDWLGSAAVSLGPLLSQATGAEDSEPDQEEPPSLKEVFGQGFDSSFDDFETRLLAYRELMADRAPADGAADMMPEASAGEPGEEQPEGRPRRPAKGGASGQ